MISPYILATVIVLYCCFFRIILSQPKGAISQSEQSFDGPIQTVEREEKIGHPAQKPVGNEQHDDIAEIDKNTITVRETDESNIQHQQSRATIIRIHSITFVTSISLLSVFRIMF